MKIAYVTPYEGERGLVAELLADHEVIFLDEPLTDTVPAEVIDAEVLSVFVSSKVTAEMIDSMPNLKVITLRSTGYDHVDAAHAKSKGVTVSYVPHYGSQTVAEFTFALMLELSRKVGSIYNTFRTSGVNEVKQFEGFDLSGKTLGVIGTGAIGQKVCKIARGFNMRVCTYDLYPNEEFAAENACECCSFEDVMRQADVISLHVPATAENKHIINVDSLALCKPGVVIVNTARGSLIDTIALLAGLKSGQVGAAGLDVFEGEAYLQDELKMLGAESVEEIEYKTYIATKELLDMDNVVVTPHVAFNSIEAKQEITKTTVGNITSALAGQPQNEVPV